MWTRVHQAARTQSPHGSMVRRRSHATISTCHADRQGCENGQEASGRGGSRQCVCRQRGPRHVLHFEYLGSQLQGDGENEADVRHRMDVAQAAFGSLSHLWSDHRLSRATKLRLNRMSVCSTLTHSCEAWTTTRTEVRMINGFSSRCLHAITGEDYRTTATVPVYNLVLAVRKRRLRYLGHVLRLPAESIVRRSLLALVKGCVHYSEGSLFSDCEASMPQLEAQSLDRSAWRDRVSSLT